MRNRSADGRLQTYLTLSIDIDRFRKAIRAFETTIIQAILNNSIEHDQTIQVVV